MGDESAEVPKAVMRYRFQRSPKFRLRWRSVRPRFPGTGDNKPRHVPGSLLGSQPCRRCKQVTGPG